MALPIDLATFYSKIGLTLTPELFNVPNQATMDALVAEAIADANAWMVVHLGSNYNLPDAASARLQARGMACLAMEYLVDNLKTQKVLGTHFAYISEESPEYQALIDLNWGERALQALDTWVTVELGGQRGFALPQFLVTSGIDKRTETALEPISQQYSDELDFARGLANSDVGTTRG